MFVSQTLSAWTLYFQVQDNLFSLFEKFWVHFHFYRELPFYMCNCWFKVIIRANFYDFFNAKITIKRQKKSLQFSNKTWNRNVRQYTNVSHIRVIYIILCFILFCMTIKEINWMYLLTTFFSTTKRGHRNNILFGLFFQSDIKLIMFLIYK